MTIFIDKKGNTYSNELYSCYTEKKFPKKKIKGGITAQEWQKGTSCRKPLENFFEKTYSLKNKDFYLLKNFVIKKKYRGLGLGSKLRGEVIKEILKTGVKIICSQPWSIEKKMSNESLRNFYIKNFKDNGAKEVFVGVNEGSSLFAVVGIF